MPLEQRIRATELVEHFVWGHRRTSSLQSASVQYEAPGGRATDVPKIARLALETPDTAAYRPSQKGISRSSRLRSEEHTSELQSLMRISYAVFCLKKKINI